MGLVFHCLYTHLNWIRPPRGGQIDTHTWNYTNSDVGLDLINNRLLIVGHTMWLWKPATHDGGGKFQGIIREKVHFSIDTLGWICRKLTLNDNMICCTKWLASSTTVEIELEVHYRINDTTIIHDVLSYETETNCSNDWLWLNEWLCEPARRIASTESLVIHEIQRGPDLGRCRLKFI